MPDHPTPPEQPGEPPEPPEASAQPGPPGPTEPLPPAQPTAPQPPTASPAPPGRTGPSGAGHGAAAAGASTTPRRPSTPRRLWGEATATTGATIALVTAGVLALVLLVTGVGLVGSWVAHRVDLAGLAHDDGRFGDGPKGRGPHDDRAGDTPHGNNGRGNGNGNGRAQGQGSGPGNSQGQGRGQGNGSDDRGGLGPGGLPGLGGVLHGEFTTSVTGTPTVMVFQSGEVSAYTEDESIEVTSTDGFEATYSIDPSTVVRGTPADGEQVRVVAAEDGMTAVLVAAAG